MSTTISGNYSQFYKGSQPIANHGSAPGGKDTVVRYEFNTTDAHGNKVMDKMSKEETMKALNEISSQYGDNVIVEFSGDGLAALEAHKGMFPEEHKEIPDWMITQLEGPTPLTEEQLKAMKGQSGTDVEAKMRVADPAAYDEYQQIKADGLASGTKEGLSSIAKYMLKWITNKAIQDPGWEDRANEKIAKETSAEQKLSTNAQKYLDSLRKQYGDYDFLVAGQDTDRKALSKSGTKEFSVIFSTDELERMARDEKYAAEKMRSVDTAVRMSKRICEEFGYERGGGKNGTLKSLTVSFDNFGRTSIFAELEKSSEKQRERIDAAREKRAEEKKEAEKKAAEKKAAQKKAGKAEEKRAEEKKAKASDEKKAGTSGKGTSDPDVKRVTITARSEDDLVEQLKHLDWNKI